MYFNAIQNILPCRHIQTHNVEHQKHTLTFTDLLKGTAKITFRKLETQTDTITKPNRQYTYLFKNEKLLLS